MNETQWRLVVAASVDRSLEHLPTKIATAVVEFMVGPLVDNPLQVGHLLQRDLSGLWSARRGAYRIVYELDETNKIVRVLRVDHRSDVYRPR